MRKTYIDNIRWITVVIVVIYHVIYMFNGVSTAAVIGPFKENQPQDVFQYVVYPWFMLLLFVVSGISARYDLEKRSEKEFIKIKTRKLLVPSTIGLLVFGWALGYYNLALGGAFEQMGTVPKIVLFLIMCVSGCGPLWYIQMLWLFCVILVWIRKIEKDRFYNICEKTNTVILILLVLLIFGSAQILNVPVVVVYRFGIYGLGFLLGYFVFSHDEVMEKIEKQWILFTILGVVSCVAFVIMYWGKSYPEHEVLDTVMCNVYAWFGTLSVLAFMKKWGNFENAFSKWMCKKSWGLYIFHYLPIAMTAWYICGDAIDRVPLYVYISRVFGVVAPLIVYVLVAIAGFAGAFLLYEIFSRIPVLRWCILGIKKENEK